ncbi:MAG: sugar phosphate isomerase/epimerase [Clostridia bacterium]|nr:sugar phosphate isomerase/epimerase [Clostridia bacterium]
MKYLLSINFRFFSVEPIQLVSLSKTYGDCDGFEISFNVFDEIEKNYVSKFIKEIKKENMIVNFHANSSLSLDKQKVYLDYIYSQTFDYQEKVSIVYHSIYDEDTKRSINLSHIFFKNIISYIKEKNYANLIISIENLNILNQKRRLVKEDFTSLLKNDDLMFTYDIGHELIDECNYNTKFLPMNKILKQKIFNIHIHTFKDLQDHCPILEDCIYKNYFKNFYENLKKINYDNFIVLEYGLFAFEPFCDTVFKQCIEYAKCIKILKNIFNN